MSCFGNERKDSPLKTSRAWKSVLHWLTLASRLAALFVLAIHLPVLLVAGLLVVLTSPGPAFVKKAYRRSRKQNEVVYLYEFRTECWQTWNETMVGKALRHAD